MRSLKRRSSFDSLGGKERVNVREMADTIAQQRMRVPAKMEDAVIPHRRAGHQDEAGAPGGTYNGKAPGTSRSDGIELMARVISAQAQGAGKRAPTSMSRESKGNGNSNADNNIWSPPMRNYSHDAWPSWPRRSKKG